MFRSLLKNEIDVQYFRMNVATLNMFLRPIHTCQIKGLATLLEGAGYRDKISVYLQRHPRAGEDTNLTSTQELVKIHNQL